MVLVFFVLSTRWGQRLKYRLCIEEKKAGDSVVGCWADDRLIVFLQQVLLFSEVVAMRPWAACCM